MDTDMLDYIVNTVVFVMGWLAKKLTEVIKKKK